MKYEAILKIDMNITMYYYILPLCYECNYVIYTNVEYHAIYTSLKDSKIVNRIYDSKYLSELSRTRLQSQVFR